jgi:hypothetical protein
VVAALLHVVVDGARCGARVVEQDVQGGAGGLDIEADLLQVDNTNIQDQLRSAAKQGMLSAGRLVGSRIVAVCQVCK